MLGIFVVSRIKMNQLKTSRINTPDLSKCLYSAEQVRELDRIAIQEFGIPGYQLMRTAGLAVFREIINRYQDAEKIVIVCGNGNNGGDGLVVARLYLEIGIVPQVIILGGVEKIGGDALLALNDFLGFSDQGISGKIVEYSDDMFGDADVIVDAIFGTGLQREVTGQWGQVIEGINNCSAGIIAVDIPSGICADSGEVLGIAVKANVTVSFVGRKMGLYTANGIEYSGDMVFNDLGVPRSIYKISPSALLLSQEIIDDLLPPRKKNVHKGDFGHVLVVGGNLGMTGAVRMAAEAALKSGAGLVSVATRSEHAAYININCPEVMSRGIDTEIQLVSLIDSADVIVLGPGLGTDEWARMVFNCVMGSDKTKIIDADGLNLLAQSGYQLPKNAILTPHPGEAARLLALSITEIQRDRFSATKSLCKKYSSVVVLKGAGTIVGNEYSVDAGVRLHVSNMGNPGMATAGMGDVLAGIIGALLGQRIDLAEAAKLGVAIHSLAGDNVAKAAGERGMMATDLFPYIRLLVNPQ